MAKLWSYITPSRLTLALTLIEAIIVIVCEIIVFRLFLDGLGYTTSAREFKGVPVYLTIFILAQVVQLGLVWDSIREKNTIQLMGVLFFRVCCLGYSILQYFQVRETWMTTFPGRDASTSSLMKDHIFQSILIVIIVTGLGLIADFFLSFRLYKDFGWIIYKKIGAGVHMKRMYLAYQIFLLLLKLDFFFFIGFAAQFLILILDRKNEEFAPTIIALPLVLCVLAAATWAVRHERSKLMIAFMGGLLLAIAYFIFKTVRIWQDPDREEKYVQFQYFLTVFAVLSLIMSILTLIQSIICLRNFGKGLRPYHLSSSKGPTDGHLGPHGDRPLALESEDESQAGMMTHIGPAGIISSDLHHPSPHLPHSSSPTTSSSHQPHLTPPTSSSPISSEHSVSTYPAPGLARGGSVYAASNAHYLSSSSQDPPPPVPALPSHVPHSTKELV